MNKTHLKIELGTYSILIAIIMICTILTFAVAESFVLLIMLTLLLLGFSKH